MGKDNIFILGLTHPFTKKRLRNETIASKRASIKLLLAVHVPTHACKHQILKRSVLLLL